MPTLRFSRDRRGYESTYLLHSPSRRAGPDQPHLLYWFRSPPHVKIGRAAFDEDAIRSLEEQHPDVEFDWDRILTTKPPAAPEPRDPREARPARRPERRPARETRRDTPRPAPDGVVAPPLPHGDGPTAEADTPAFAAEPPGPEPLVVPRPPVVDAAPEPVVADQTGVAPTRRFVRVFDAPPEPPDVSVHHASEPSAVERTLGTEQLTVLRARYAEILLRISARGGDPARMEALRTQAASVDPDGWVTEADVTAGLAVVDATLLELHRIVGRRRRRRRRRRADAPAGAAPWGATPPDDGDASIDDGDSDESEDDSEGSAGE